MIRLQRISTADGFLYEYMEQLITAAFPPEEYRPLEELRLYTDNKPHFYNNIIFHHDTPVGFITYWDFDKFYYVEHFAVDPAQRNGLESIERDSQRKKDVAVCKPVGIPECQPAHDQKTHT